jgi:hypothetical protein
MPIAFLKGRLKMHLKLKLILLFLGSFVLAQAQDRGSIEGTVTDASRSVVPAAKVEVVQQDTNATWSVTTNGAGRYYAPSLPLGEYRVIVQHDGFNTATSAPVEIRSQTNARVDVVLQLGAISEKIEVSADAELLDTASATSSTSITTKYIGELPLISFGSKPNIADYLKYLPGTESSSGGAPVVNGSQSNTNEVYVDGAPASQGLNRGSLSENGAAVTHYGEFNVVSNSFSAEYGRTGAFFYNVTIKSGTNQLHGSLYDNFVNTDLNARDFFQATRQIYHQNNGGVTVGAPVYIPKLYNGRNRTFFFFGEDLFYSKGAGTGNLLTIPTLAMRQGDFSSYRTGSGGVIPIFDPASDNGAGARTQFPGNIIPSNRISQVSQKMIALMPAPDLPTQSANWRNRTGANPLFNIFSMTARIDHNISDRHKIFVSYTDELRPRKIAGLGWGADPLEGFQENPEHNMTGRFSYDAIIRPTLINHLTLGADRYGNPAISSTAGQGWDAKLGLTGLPWDFGGFPLVQFSGGTDTPINMGQRIFNFLGEGRYSLIDTLSWSKGSHIVKAGVNFLYEYRNEPNTTYGNGWWTFTNTVTSQPAATQYTQWGSPVASFLLGAPGTAYTTGPKGPATRIPYQALFFQDEWHATKKLSLSLGLRWENNSPMYDKYDRVANFNPATPNPGAGNIPGALVFAGTGAGRTGSSTVFPAWHKGFSPRVGYALQITPKLVMRSSIGIFYSAPSVGVLNFQGFAAQATFQSPNGYTPAYRWDSPFPAFPTQAVLDPAVLNGQPVTWYDPNFARTSQVLSWTSGFQYQISQSVLLDTSYIGHHGTHLEAGYLGNPDVLNPSYLSLGSLLAQPITSAGAVAAGIKSPWQGFSGSSLNTVGQALRPYPQYSDVTDSGAKVGIDRYNSLQVKVTKRFSKGMTAMASYTWSKNMTNVPTPGGANSAQNPYNRAAEVSVSEVTPPNDFKISFAYDLPFGSGKSFLNRKGVLDKVVGGWQLVGFVQRASGLALTILATDNLSGYGIQTKRANVISGQPLTLNTDMGSFDPAVNRFINPAAFAAPAAYALGNTARTLDWLRGWPLHNESASLNKNFRLYERVGMRLGVNLDNPFNAVRWGAPVTNVNASNFGAVTSTAPGPQDSVDRGSEVLMQSEGV